MSTYWDKRSNHYLSLWRETEARNNLDRQEMMFVTKAMKTHRGRALAQKKTYLDLGCGPGRIISWIRAFDPSYKRIIAIDSSEKMCAVALHRFGRDPKIQIICHDVQSLAEIKSKSIDVITAIRVVKYISSRDELFKQIHRVLAPGGLCIFTVTNAHSLAFFDFLDIAHYKDTKRSITDVLTRNRFTVKQITGIRKLPEIFYVTFSHGKLLSLLYLMERLFSVLFGKTCFSRVLYVVAQKI